MQGVVVFGKLFESTSISRAGYSVAELVCSVRKSWSTVLVRTCLCCRVVNLVGRLNVVGSYSGGFVATFQIWRTMDGVWQVESIGSSALSKCDSIRKYGQTWRGESAPLSIQNTA